MSKFGLLSTVPTGATARRAPITILALLLVFGFSAAHGAPIHTATRKGDVDTVRELLDQGEERTVAQHCSISYLAPVSEGDRLTAIARENVRSGRSGIYDVRVVNQHGQHVAEFRGHSRTVKGTHLPGSA